VARKISLAVVLAAFACAAVAPLASAMDLERLIAPTTTCANETDAGATVAAQEQAMRCMTDFARERMGMGGLEDAGDLNQSASDKADDILRCDDFSHYACGREFTYWMQRVGYIPARCWRAGENLAWGSGEDGTVRSIFSAWIHSPDHRENILGPYDQIGIGLEVGNLEGHSDVDVWIQHFGSHCGPPSRQAPAVPVGLAVARAAP
jgi:uncharacterized protein YkwD